MFDRSTTKWGYESLRLSILDLGSGTGPTDRQTDDGLMPPPYGSGRCIVIHQLRYLGIISDTLDFLSVSAMMERIICGDGWDGINLGNGMGGESDQFVFLCSCLDLSRKCFFLYGKYRST